MRSGQTCTLGTIEKCPTNVTRIHFHHALLRAPQVAPVALRKRDNLPVASSLRRVYGRPVSPGEVPVGRVIDGHADAESDLPDEPIFVGLSAFAFFHKGKHLVTTELLEPSTRRHVVHVGENSLYATTREEEGRVTSACKKLAL
jgi:hypothetical protein